MNAHDRLRLYLEQRRELGENELVLDSLPVDSVLRMIGAPTAKGSTVRGATAAPASAPQNTSANASHTVSSPRSPELAPESLPTVVDNIAPLEPPTRFDNTVSTDWRAALSGLKPGASQKSAENARDEPTEAGMPAPNAAASAPNAGAPTPSTANTTSSSSDDSAGTSKPAAVYSDGAAGPASVAPAGAFPSWLVNLGLPIGLSAEPSSALAATTDTAHSAGSIDELATVIAACRACSLGALATHAVPGEGNINADFVCVGEAPGQTEDETGRPFVGAAGQLLTKILSAIQLQRDDVFICNVLKHRPPGNRNPLPDEIHACTPYLTRQLALTKPKVILALGTFAAQTLLNTTTALGKLRGQVHQYQGVPLIVTYHPAALLRNEAWKRPTWDDVKLARRILDAARSNDAVSPAT